MTEAQMAMFEGCKALGLEITDKPWGALLFLPDANGISSPPTQMIEIREVDGVVICWPDVGPDDTPETMTEIMGESCESLQEFVDVTYRNLINNELDNEDWYREDLIQFMIGQGWEKDLHSGKVRHANDHDKAFDSWFDAAKACIGVASEF